MEASMSLQSFALDSSLGEVINIMIIIITLILSYYLGFP